jgi:AcrR family transcriptional regulator
VRDDVTTMPRISAPTVAEHRVRQRAAILRAAEQVALERGGAAVSITAVAARTGLARPSVYAYFPSAEQLLVTLVLEAFGRWESALRDATHGAPDADAVVRAYFAAAARSAAAGNHRLAAALSGVPLPGDVRRVLVEQHRAAATPLAAAVAELAGSDATPADEAGETVADRRLALLTSLVSHCISRVEAGADPAVEASEAAEFALGGLAGTHRRT